MNKKVIFIGGTSFSGSTMLDMILANDPKGYSLGEIHALFRPYRKHHFEEINKIIKDSRWKNILNGGEKHLYENLFKHFPDIEFFVDSSKNPLWIKEHSNILKEKNIEVKNILIYKTPLEIAYSFNKRNIYKQWKKAWINYHKFYFSLISSFRTIGYKDLTNNKDSLYKICEYLGIPFFEKKHEFWLKEQNTFFGNNRARVHTSNLSSTGKEKVALLRDENEYRKIYYEKIVDETIIDDVNKVTSADNKINKILKVLEKQNLLSKHYTNYEISSYIKFSSREIFVRKLKEMILTQKANIFYK